MKAYLRPISLLLIIGLFIGNTALAQAYDLYLIGVQVTADNAADLTVIEGVSGTVFYTPETQTLTLENATIQDDQLLAIYNPGVEGLTIKIGGDNAISSFEMEADTDIVGPGYLAIGGSEDDLIAIYLKAQLQIKECGIKATGVNWGITGLNGESGEHLIIRNSDVEATGGRDGSIADLESFTLIHCSILFPEGAFFDEISHDVILDGQIVKEQILIAPLIGLQEAPEMANIDLYPNPVKDLLEIESAHVLTRITVCDMLGRILFSEPVGSRHYAIDASDWDQGVYNVTLYSDTHRVSHKVLKQ